MKLLNIRSLNPIKYSLSLLDAFFTDEQMATHSFSSRGTKLQLPQEKLDLIKGEDSNCMMLL